MEPSQIDPKLFVSDVVDPPLHFQPYPFTNWLLHPDWPESVVNLSQLVGLDILTLRLLHPIDLLITKLERARDRDIEDSLLLRERYVSSIEEARQRTFEAAQYYALSDRSRGQIERSFEAIFEEPIDLSKLM